MLTRPNVFRSVPLAAAKDTAFDNSSYIVSPFYDSFFFIFSPVLALALGVLISFTPLAEENFLLYGHRESFASLFSGTLTMAHLVIVFFRSHANPSIFCRYPVRFIAAPLVLFTALALSSWFLVFVFVLAVWWDVYHSALQTFGIGRIYDSRCGNDARTGRGLDKGINLLLYVGPILAGATLLDHAVHFEKFKEVGPAAFAVIPAFAKTQQRYLTLATLAAGMPYILYYLYSYWRLECQGYRISRQKVLLFAATGGCSVITWGFNTFGQAFFIMNFFHAFQYFALVWWNERKNITAVFGLGRWAWGRRAALVLFMGAAIGYGLWAKVWGESNHLALSVLLTVSILHFWYDGFIWSVTKRMVY